MTTESTPGNVPLSAQLGPANEAQPLVERAAFEAWFLARYSYTRAVLANPIWASEIKAAAEAFEAGRAAERERWEKALRMLRDAVVSQNRSGASWDERVFGPMMGGLALAAELLDWPNVEASRPEGSG